MDNNYDNANEELNASAYPLQNHASFKIQRDNEGYQPPRAGIILLQALVGFFFFVFVIRFWYLQVHRGPEFAQLAQDNRMRKERIIAPRGRILDQS